MSSIFKALKKLEKDQARGTDVTPRLSSVLLSEISEPKKGLSPALLIVVGVAAGAALAFLGLSLRDSQTELSDQDQVAIASVVKSQPQPSEVVTSAPVAPSPDTSSYAAPEKQAGVTPAPKVKPPVVKAARRPSTSATSKKPTAVVARQKTIQQIPTAKTIDEVRFGADEVVTVSSSVENVDKMLAPRQPAIQVSEIYYQPDGQESMAVVNDLPVMEGTQIDDAIVKKILPDRVLMLVRGEQVEIPLIVTPD